MSLYFPKAHGLFFMMEIVFLFRITSRNLAMEYHFIQRKGSNNADRFLLSFYFELRRAFIRGAVL